QYPLCIVPRPTTRPHKRMSMNHSALQHGAQLAAGCEIELYQSPVRSVQGAAQGMQAQNM
ncbi:MAG: hypothetical protein ACXVCX_02760, partial [Ktedonobacterales bacterium]